MDGSSRANFYHQRWRACLKGQSTVAKGRSKKEPAKGRATASVSTAAIIKPARAGLPAEDSIASEMMLKSPKPGGGTFRIIRTLEIDAYELPPPTAGLAVPLDVRAVAIVGDDFKGAERKAAKLSIASAPTEQFKDLKSLIQSLPADKVMKTHKPKISTAATSNRVKEEKRNVKVKAFLYAASREDDNDFHLILGRKAGATPEMYLTMELSGLPKATSASFSKLKAARDSFKSFFGQNLPGVSYDFYDPPLPVLIEGSLFFDMTHATGQRPGPQSLKSRMPTIWEVHPLTRIVFEP